MPRVKKEKFDFSTVEGKAPYSSITGELCTYVNSEGKAFETSMQQYVPVIWKDNTPFMMEMKFICIKEEYYHPQDAVFEGADKTFYYMKFKNFKKIISSMVHGRVTELWHVVRSGAFDNFYTIKLYEKEKE